MRSLEHNRRPANHERSDYDQGKELNALRQKGQDKLLKIKEKGFQGKEKPKISNEELKQTREKLLASLDTDLPGLKESLVRAESPQALGDALEGIGSALESIDKTALTSEMPQENLSAQDKKDLERFSEGDFSNVA
jgi:hypothetical protein